MTQFLPFELTVLTSLASCAAAAICLGAAVLLWKRGRRAPSRALTIAALGTGGAVLLANGLPLVDPRVAWLVEILRNLSVLALIAALFAADGRHSGLAPLRPVLFALAVAEFAQLPLVILTEWFQQEEARELVMGVGALIRMLFSVGVLVLLHNLFAGASPEQRERLRHMSAALVLAWGLELNFHAFSYMLGGAPQAMLIVRALTWSVVAALMFLGGIARPERRFQPSRSITFQSLSLLVIGFYLIGLFALDALLRGLDLDLGAASQFLAVLIAVVIAALLASPGLRSLVRETLTRNLFRHRFDYRLEWLRFSQMMGAHDGHAEPLGHRAVQALAGIVDSPGGLLLEPAEDGGFALSARWQWAEADVPPLALDEAAIAALMQHEGVLPLDPLRAEDGWLARQMPRWLIEDVRAWAVVPLLLENRMAGAVVLARPAYARALDWEDNDLLRIISQQLAAHLFEHNAQRALLEAARFDEFNRRMAFVMHDIKNLASQLGLTVSNAEKHMENPAFRADMLVTLRNATSRMEGLLARLSRYGARIEGQRASLSPHALAEQLFGQLPYSGRVRVGAGGEMQVRADREALEQVLRHLVHNAIDASHASAPIEIRFQRTDSHAGIEIADRGSGMSAEFVRSQLFAPFVSTKPDGFGIGAYEAREMVRAMGGRIDVVSREGEGTRVTLWLPLAHAAPADLQKPSDMRKEVA